jgi:hypothetical protein
MIVGIILSVLSLLVVICLFIIVVGRVPLTDQDKEVIIEQLKFYRLYINELDSNYNQKKITKEDYDSELRIIDKQLRDMERYLVWYTR